MRPHPHPGAHPDPHHHPPPLAARSACGAGRHVDRSQRRDAVSLRAPPRLCSQRSDEDTTPRRRQAAEWAAWAALFPVGGRPVGGRTLAAARSVARVTRGASLRVRAQHAALLLRVALRVAAALGRAASRVGCGSVPQCMPAGAAARGGRSQRAALDFTPVAAAGPGL
eukprot:6985802-Prymnesium_polylepis.1